MNKYAVVTKHAETRLIERNGANKKSLNRIANKALKSGFQRQCLNGRLRKYVDRLYYYSEKMIDLRVYGDKIYLFDKNALVTVLQIPSNLTKDLKNMIKTKEKGVKNGQ